MWIIGKVGAVGSSGRTGIHPPIFVRPASDSGRFHSRPRIANYRKLNRQTPEIERLVTRRKQITAICSNRQEINFCLDENQPLNSFLTGTASQVECDVSPTKQTTGEFLPGARTAHSASRMFPRDASSRAATIREMSGSPEKSPAAQQFLIENTWN